MLFIHFLKRINVAKYGVVLAVLKTMPKNDWHLSYICHLYAKGARARGEYIVSARGIDFICYSRNE